MNHVKITKALASHDYSEQILIRHRVAYEIWGRMSQSTSKEAGERGEMLAAEYLVKQGYRIVARNWRTRLGEIDIVVETADGVNVFVEVKTRRANDVNPLESITMRKRKLLISTAHHYLMQHQLMDASWRFDVIAVTFTPHQRPHIEHYQDAFDW